MSEVARHLNRLMEIAGESEEARMGVKGPHFASAYHAVITGMVVGALEEIQDNLDTFHVDVVYGDDGFLVQEIVLTHEATPERKWRVTVTEEET